jgi:hypothetical protein
MQTKMEIQGISIKIKEEDLDLLLPVDEVKVIAIVETVTEVKVVVWVLVMVIMGVMEVVMVVIIMAMGDIIMEIIIKEKDHQGVKASWMNTMVVMVMGVCAQMDLNEASYRTAVLCLIHNQASFQKNSKNGKNNKGRNNEDNSNECRITCITVYNKALHGKTRKNNGPKYSQERVKNMRLQ